MWIIQQDERINEPFYLYYCLTFFKKKYNYYQEYLFPVSVSFFFRFFQVTSKILSFCVCRNITHYIHWKETNPKSKCHACDLNAYFCTEEHQNSLAIFSVLVLSSSGNWLTCNLPIQTSLYHFGKRFEHYRYFQILWKIIIKWRDRGWRGGGFVGWGFGEITSTPKALVFLSGTMCCVVVAANTGHRTLFLSLLSPFRTLRTVTSWSACPFF